MLLVWWGGGVNFFLLLVWLIRLGITNRELGHRGSLGYPDPMASGFFLRISSWPISPSPVLRRE